MRVGHLLVVAGLVLVCLGAAVVGLEKLHLPLGRLPGDLMWRGKHSAFYFPLATCLLISCLATLVVWFAGKLR